MTKINPNSFIESEGIRFIQRIVENNFSIFEEISGRNDKGNDCYIEFAENKIATNYCAFVQIKSGISYKNKHGYFIPADRDHLKYWSQSLYLSIGIVYDPEIQKAFWVDITNYLKKNSKVLNQQSHSIRVDSESEFSSDTFNSFKTYCTNYKNELLSFENFGRSLDLFSNINNSIECYEGLKALFLNHQEKDSAWFYIITNFGNISEDGIKRNILGMLSNFLNDNVFWNPLVHRNYLDEGKRKYISNLISEHFGAKELELLIPYLEEGITKGSFSYLVYLIISLIKDNHQILKGICFREIMDNEKRYFCFWLYLHLAKYLSIDDTLNVAENFLSKYPDAYEDEVIIGLIECIKSGDLVPIG